MTALAGPRLYSDAEGEPDDGRELAWKWAICGACDGHGKSSAYLGAFSGRRLQEAQDDSEFWEDYMAGNLDRACEECDGGRVKVLDESRISQEDLAAWRVQEEGEAADRETNRMERLMEGGWRELGWFDE